MFFCLESIFSPHFLSIRLQIDTFDVKNKSSGIIGLEFWESPNLDFYREKTVLKFTSSIVFSQ